MIDLEKIKEAVWVDFSDDEAYKIKFLSDPQLRTLSNRKDISIETFTDSKDPEPEKEIPQDKDDFISGILNALLSTEVVTAVAVQSVEAWKGITLDSKEYECNEKNRKALFELSAKRAMWVYRQSRNEKNWKQDLKADVKN